MNGKKPKSPLRGCQDEEKKRSVIDFDERIGFDFRKRTMAIVKANEFMKINETLNDFVARESFTTLQWIIIYKPLKKN
jgi:hypothetical protein